MKGKLKYLLPILSITVLVATSSCKVNDDLSYYYNANSTGAGNGNSSCGCCGCCNNTNNNNNASTNAITPYCEPDAPQTTFCSDGTITINAYKGVSFATEDSSCSSGQYMAIADGVMTLDANSELLNPAGKPLYWIAAGATSASIAVIPTTEDSISVLPDGTVLGYIGGVSSTLGKLIVVSVTSGCGNPVSPLATIGSSILWCGQRVCVKKTTNNGLVPAVQLVKMRVSIFDGTNIVLSQAAFSREPALVPDLYATGIKEISVTDKGDVVEASTCLPIKSTTGSLISLTAAPTSLSISRSAEFLVDNEPWANIAIVNVVDTADLVNVTDGNLPTGIKGPQMGKAGYLTITTAEADPAVIDPVEAEQNVCTDNPLQNVIALSK
jgi:hypothetical protein